MEGRSPCPKAAVGTVTFENSDGSEGSERYCFQHCLIVQRRQQGDVLRVEYD